MRFLPALRIIAAVCLLSFLGVRSVRMHRRSIRNDQRFQPSPHTWVSDFDEDVRAFLPFLANHRTVGFITTDQNGVRRGARLIVLAYALKPHKILRGKPLKEKFLILNEAYAPYDQTKLSNYKLLRSSSRFKLSLYTREEDDR